MQDDAQMSGERAGEGGLVQVRDGSRGVLEDWPQLCVAGRRFERRPARGLGDGHVAGRAGVHNHNVDGISFECIVAPVRSFV